MKTFFWKDKSGRGWNATFDEVEVLKAFEAELKEEAKVFQCGSCEQAFDKPNDGSCPICGSGNFVHGYIDEYANTLTDFLETADISDTWENATHFLIRTN